MWLFRDCLHHFSISSETLKQKPRLHTTASLHQTFWGWLQVWSRSAALTLVRAGQVHGGAGPCSCPVPTSTPAGTPTLPPASLQSTEEQSSYCQGWCINDRNTNTWGWCLMKGEDHTLLHSAQLSPAQTDDNYYELSVRYQRTRKLLEAPASLGGDHRRADAWWQQSQGSLLVIAALGEL